MLFSASAHAAPPQIEELSLRLESQRISALWMLPAEARALLVLAHGAANNMRDPLMESLSLALAQHGIATLRFNFPYAEAGRSKPDAPPLMQAALR
ncbi:MAG: alpha/beta family hydrolase, partial [Myxococcota bacterium]